MPLRSAIAELHRRRVFAAAAGYLVAAWVVVQVADLLFPLFDVPDGALRWLVVALGILFVPATIAAWMLQWTPDGMVRDSGERPDAVVPNRVVLLPLKAVGDQDHDYFAEGLTEEIAVALARTRRLEVVARDSAERAGADAAPAMLRRRLGAAYSLRGTVRRGSDRVRVTVSLQDTGVGASVWSEVFEREFADLLTMQAEIAAEVVDALELEDGRSAAPLPALGPTRAGAYDRYLAGRYLLARRSAEGIRAAGRAFEEATEADADLAQGWAGLAEARLLAVKYDLLAPRDGFPPAHEAATRAIELEPELSDAHATLGAVLALGARDHDAATRAFGAALRLNPSSTAALQWRAVDLLLPLARFDEATADLDRARELDPLSPIMWVSAALPPFFSTDFARAVRLCDHALELAPNLGVAHLFRAQARALLGDLDPAVRDAERARELMGGTPESTAAVGFVRALAGDTDGALRALNRLRDRPPDRFVSPDLAAHVLLALGRADDAIRALQQAAEAGAYRLAYLGVDPRLEGVRSDPRLEAVLRAPAPLSFGG